MLNTAESHFGGIQKGLALGQLLSTSARSDVLEVYERYCAATACTPIYAVDITAPLDKKVRPEGEYAQSKALAVVDALGGRTIFIIDKALEAIAG